MALSKQEWIELENKAHELRNLCLDTTHWAGSGHIGGGLSCMDMLTILYYKYLSLDPSNPDWADRDRFILSKGHAGIAWAPVLVSKGYNDPEQLKTFNLTNSKMGIHLDANKVVGVDASTGSLGHGLPIAVGTALAARVQKKDYWTYCIMGDGECDEGEIWEAAMSAAHFGVTNLISFVDRNECMIDGPTEDVMKLEPFADKWAAFGFLVKEVDGQNLDQLDDAIAFAKANTTGKPVVIISHTKKGAGIAHIEGDYKWHYGAMDEDSYQKGKASLAEYHQARLARAEKEGE
ncbi:MAG: transketolase [Oscillospiraceae bacterium]|jgi:transketolase|nr:transketolase [Oscillospiraceae bacterium]